MPTEPGKVVLGMSVSLDGYFEGPDADIGWHRVDDELHAYFNQTLARMSGFLEGRVTWELMDGFWPTADQDPDAPEPVAEFARIWRETPKYVFSRSLQSAEWNTTIVREVQPSQIEALKAGGDLAVGGAHLAATFFRLGLVDEIRIYVHPVLLGAGRRLLPEGGKRLSLELLDERTFGNGVVMLHYAVR